MKNRTDRKIVAMGKTWKLQCDNVQHYGVHNVSGAVMTRSDCNCVPVPMLSSAMRSVAMWIKYS